MGLSNSAILDLIRPYIYTVSTIASLQRESFLFIEYIFHSWFSWLSDLYDAHREVAFFFSLPKCVSLPLFGFRELLS